MQRLLNLMENGATNSINHIFTYSGTTIQRIDGSVVVPSPRLLKAWK